MKLCHFIIGVMKDKVLDVAFPFKLEQLDKVTLRLVRCSCAFEWKRTWTPLRAGSMVLMVT